MATVTSEREKREQDEFEKREAARKEGVEALAKKDAAESAKSDEQRAKDEEQARAQAAKRAEEEAKRAAEEREAAEKAVKELPANTRLVKAGTIIQFNGEEAEVMVDAFIRIPGADDESVFAAVLARNPQNLEKNEATLRLRYNPMNGVPLPLSEQRLKPEEMTPFERRLFGLPELAPAEAAPAEEKKKKK